MSGASAPCLAVFYLLNLLKVRAHQLGVLLKLSASKREMKEVIKCVRNALINTIFEKKILDRVYYFILIVIST